MKSIKNLLVDNKIAIIIGIITSFIWSILDWLVNVIPPASKNIFIALRDLKYYLASGVTIESIYSFILSIVIGMVSGIILGLICGLIVFRKKKKTNIKLEKIGEIINDKDDFLLRLFKILLFLLLCLIIIILLAFNIALNVKQGFLLDMQEIKPYISDNEYDLLISKWTQMDSKDDYDIIYKDIKKVIVEYNLKELKYYVIKK